MKVQGKAQRSIWRDDKGGVQVIDQRELPHRFVCTSLRTSDCAARAISEMWVRGAPLIGATAAYGLALACAEDSGDAHLAASAEKLMKTRPTAVNLRWAVERMQGRLREVPHGDRQSVAFDEAGRICEEDVAACKKIGEHGFSLLKERARALPQGTPLRILTHCNAGWLATVDWGTALAPIYRAQQEGFPLMVYVDETRPRNQGASLTAWELGQAGIPNTVIVDNLGGHLMQKGMIDLCIVGSDRTSARGDVCNKIGTYLKALAAHDNQVPFYVALPFSTIDWTLEDGLADTPIEERDAREVSHMRGIDAEGVVREISILPKGSSALNLGFDVTPARLVSALVTEHGVFEASAHDLQRAKSEHL